MRRFYDHLHHVKTITTHMGEHVLKCIDGEKEPPKWLHRSHRVGHVLYLGTGVFALEWIHMHVVGVLCVIEVLTFVVGSDWPEVGDIDPE
jgi:hypothetical protein